MKEGILEHQERRNNNGKIRNMDGEKLDHPHIAAGNVNGTASLENCLAVSCKTNMLWFQRR